MPLETTWTKTVNYDLRVKDPVGCQATRLPDEESALRELPDNHKWPVRLMSGRTKQIGLESPGTECACESTFLRDKYRISKCERLVCVL